MKTEQLARYNAYSLAISYLLENENITKAVPAFATTCADAKAKLDTITQHENRRQQISSRATVQKEQLQTDLANQAEAVAAVIGSYASRKKDAKLLESVSFSPTALHYASAQVLSSRCNNILNLAKELAEPLKEYGISAEMITSLATLTEEYAANVQAPRIEKGDRKNAGTEIRELIQELDTIFNNQLDGLMLLFRFSHRSFYNGYLIKREIQERGHRKTRLEGLVVEKGTTNGLQGVELIIDDTATNVQTGAEGNFDLKLPLLTGAMARFKKAGYKTVELPVTLRRGQVTRLEVELEKE